MTPPPPSPHSRSRMRHCQRQQFTNLLTLLVFRKRRRQPRLKLIPLVFRTWPLKRTAAPRRNTSSSMAAHPKLILRSFRVTGWKGHIHRCVETNTSMALPHAGSFLLGLSGPGCARMSSPGRESVLPASDRKSIAIFWSTRSRFPTRNAVLVISTLTWWAPSHPPMVLIIF
jgi:hypothetical protein